MSKSVPRQSHARMSSGMSTTRMTSRQSGKMSGAHGTNSGNATKGMYNAKGRLGADCKGFSSGIRNPGGPRKVD